jgi:uncharacterized OB-fold protein
VTEPQKPLPDLDDPVAGRFWREAAEQRLSFQRCRDCTYLRWPPAALCPECWSREAEWEAVSPDGSVWSYGVYERAFAPAFAADVPYVVALVELDAGPRMLTRLVGVEPAEAAVGMRVTARFAPFAGGALVEFGPA